MTTSAKSPSSLTTANGQIPVTAYTIDHIQPSPDQRIHLPGPLAADLKQAANTLLKIDAESKKVVAFAEAFPGFHPGDAGVCFMRLLRRMFGFVSMDGTPTFFGTRPPQMFNVRTGVGPSDMEPMVFGEISVPGLGETVSMQIQIDFSRKTPCLMIKGSCENRHLAGVTSVLSALKRELPALSIYRGKAVKVSWQWQRDGTDYSITEHAPQFLDLSRGDYSRIVLTAEAQRQVAANLVLPIKNREEWRRRSSR